MNNFIAQLGNETNLDFLEQQERLSTLVINQNPFIVDVPLAANAGVFFGRQIDLFPILAALRRANKPACVSVLGDKKIGKSSLLKQIYQSLAIDSGLVSIYCQVKDWQTISAADFFRELQAALCLAIDQPVPDAVAADCQTFAEFIDNLGRDNGYRFVLVVDDFEQFLNNSRFDLAFFTDLHHLLSQPQYRFGLLVAGNHPLQQLCEKADIAQSALWTNFSIVKVLGVLMDYDAQQLLSEPIKVTLPGRISDTEKRWQKVKLLTGCHPLLIQLVGFDYWNQLANAHEMDKIALEKKLSNVLEQWFYQHCAEDKQHWWLLLNAAASKILPETAALQALQQRGLINKQGRLCCVLFAKTIKEECLNLLGVSLTSILNDVTSTEALNDGHNYYQLMMNAAIAAGKIR